MRLFGSERLIKMFNALGIPENQEIEHKTLPYSIAALNMGANFSPFFMDLTFTVTLLEKYPGMTDLLSPAGVRCL